MSADVPFIVALDGPSDTGKSTLAQAMRGSLGVEVIVLPCYADLAGAELPPARAKDDDEQLRSLKYFLALENQRREIVAGTAAEGVVIADRSWLGLLGHTYAIERTGGPSVYEQATALLWDHASELLQPDLVLFLHLDDAGRRARAAPTDHDAWFTCELFNAQINRFFTDEARSLLPGIVEQLDAAPDRPEVLRNAKRTILARRESRT